jgi:hypothetical protein
VVWTAIELIMVIVLPTLVFSSLYVFITCRYIYRHAFGAKWWMAFLLLSFAGIIFAVSAAFVWGYNPTDSLRVEGFPIPIAIFKLEGTQWTDFVSSMPIQIFTLFANIFACVALALVPLTIASRVASRRKRQP